MTYSRIMVGIDFSDTSLLALEHGKALAREADGDLEILHVHEPAFVPPVTAGVPAPVAGAYDAADALAANQHALRKLLEAHGLLDTATPMVRSGDPALTIAEAALEEQRDLVVVGTHGRSGLSRVVLGSVAEKVIRHSPCPVLVVPRAPETTSQA